MNVRMATMMALTMAAMFQDGNDTIPKKDISRTENKTSHPWDNIDIPKSERKGRTYDQIQEMRKERWEMAE